MGLVQFCVLAFATLCVDALTPFRGGSKLFRDHLQQSTNGPSFVNAKEPSGTTSLTTLAATFPQFNFTQPLDHFVDTGFTFPQRYWVSTRHYKTGGPVIVLDGGETSGAGRLSFLDTGIVDILANATNGLGIVLEHRYYGKSVPVQNFTTDSLRWLNNEQAAADSANFMQHVQIPGLSDDITAPNTPWIYYGGSYAGARSAHMKVLYPDIVFGAIASSGVTFATIDNWQYYDIIRRFADQDCIKQVETTVLELDKLLSSNSTRSLIQGFFGVPNITHVEDVGNLISFPLGNWQNNNWDSAVGSTGFADFCTALGKPDSNKVEITKGISVSSATVNYASYINKTFVPSCRGSQTQDDCFGSFDPTIYQATDLSQTWRLWDFQVCTQWGFFAAAPPANHPRIISKFITVDYLRILCDFAYPPGEHFTVPKLPNVADVNKLGGLNIAHDKLAIVDGEADPWRPNTAHADEAKSRPDTAERPFKLIKGAVHHYDENGLADPSQEPPTIQEIHAQEVEFVKGWLKEFKV
ncbi:hypothetical protein QCA50_005978 [Cerrena zonata]|uniref:Peptidase S28 n=1 Tax=Cerrena zonata TaxID=2478898 RepID=A0AAW0GBX2_9APHY